MATLNRRQARVAISNREPFKGSNVYGYTFSHGTGILSHKDDLDRFMQDVNTATYFVYSYSTPIAWYTPEHGWYKVKQKFSQTTSCHWGLVPIVNI